MTKIWQLLFCCAVSVLKLLPWTQAVLLTSGNSSGNTSIWLWAWELQQETKTFPLRVCPNMHMHTQHTQAQVSTAAHNRVPMIWLGVCGVCYNLLKKTIRLVSILQFFSTFSNHSKDKIDCGDKSTEPTGHCVLWKNTIVYDFWLLCIHICICSSKDDPWMYFN